MYNYTEVYCDYAFPVAKPKLKIPICRDFVTINPRYDAPAL